MYRSRSAEVAAQCGVIDDKVLQALQHIDEALEAEVSSARVHMYMQQYMMQDSEITMQLQKGTAE